MSRKTIYLLLCIAGIALPYWQFVPWVAQHGLNAPLFWHQLFSNRISAFFAMDVLVSAVALLVYVRLAGSPRGLKRWLPLLAVVTVGVSLALPLFLYLNEHGKDASAPIKHSAF